MYRAYGILYAWQGDEGGRLARYLLHANMSNNVRLLLIWLCIWLGVAQHARPATIRF